jgi:hypothetical protein
MKKVNKNRRRGILGIISGGGLLAILSKKLSIPMMIIILIATGATGHYIRGEFWSINEDTLVPTNTSHHVLLGRNGTTNYTLEVDGTTNLNGTLTVENGVIYGDGGGITNLSLWIKVGNTLYPLNNENMQINGTVNIEGDLTISPDKNFTWSSYFSDTVSANSNGHVKVNVFDRDYYPFPIFTSNVDGNGITRDADNGNITFTNGGIYSITFNGIATVSASDEFFVNILINNASVYKHDIFIHPAVDPAHQSITIIKQVEAGDYLRCYWEASDGVDLVYVQAGTTLSINRIA